MTRKDYVKLAEAMHRIDPRESGITFEPRVHADYLTQWRCDVDAISDVLAADNPRFDRERFYRACEGGK